MKEKEVKVPQTQKDPASGKPAICRGNDKNKCKTSEKKIQERPPQPGRSKANPEKNIEKEVPGKEEVGRSHRGKREEEKEGAEKKREREFRRR